jgi:hypothetical protein
MVRRPSYCTAGVVPSGAVHTQSSSNRQYAEGVAYRNSVHRIANGTNRKESDIAFKKITQQRAIRVESSFVLYRLSL